MKFIELDENQVVSDNKAKFVSFFKGESDITLEGSFTLDELKEIIAEVEKPIGINTNPVIQS